MRTVRIADLALPRIVAVDGRSGSGKSTVAARIVALTPRATVVHTDDIAWHHAFFDWADLLAEGVLAPLRAGEAVSYRPPAWDERDREGAITVAADCPLVLVEGCGAGRRGLPMDALIWVDIDLATGRARCLERDGADHAAFLEEWQAEEEPFLDADRPWERADLVVVGAPVLPHDPSTELVVR